MFVYLIKATLQGMVLFLPIAAIAWPALFIGCLARLNSKERFQDRELLIGIPLLFTAVLIAYGTIFTPDDGRSVERWRENVILVILGIQVLFSGILIWKLRRLRLVAVCFLLFQFCLSVVAGFEAAMSVTNRWL